MDSSKVGKRILSALRSNPAPGLSQLEYLWNKVVVSQIAYNVKEIMSLLVPTALFLEEREVEKPPAIPPLMPGVPCTHVLMFLGSLLLWGFSSRVPQAFLLWRKALWERHLGLFLLWRLHQNPAAFVEG